MITTLSGRYSRRNVGCHNSPPGTRQKFPDAVRIDVDHVLDLVAHPERRQKRDRLRSGSPEYRALPYSGPVAKPAAPCRTLARRCGSKAAAQADDRAYTVLVVGCEIRSVPLRTRHDHQILATIPRPDPPYREAGPDKQAPQRRGAKIRAVLIIDIPKRSLFQNAANIGYPKEDDRILAISDGADKCQKSLCLP